MRIPRKALDEELIDSLRTNINLLRNHYNKAFNENDKIYLVDIVTKLRLLICKGQGNNLLTRVMEKYKIDIPITLNRPGGDEKQTLEEYLDEVAIFNSNSKGEPFEMTRREFIAKWSEQDGGAHFDEKIEEGLYLAKNSGIKVFNQPIHEQCLGGIARTVLYVSDKVLERLGLEK